MLDQRLVRAINQGRCFALVGSGPSCEIGYPSWRELAEKTSREVLRRSSSADAESYETYLKQKKYPELFRQAERDFGQRSELVEFLKTLLPSDARTGGFLYRTLANWPFACYLTTNYDDELARHLRKLGEHFTVIRNRKTDFHALRDGASHLIQKLHSDLDHPDEVVITSEDYRRLYVSPEGAYFQSKLRQVLEMFDIFIIGHSLSDPDIDRVLQLARETASPAHPIYMIASGLTQADEREYLEKYNIVLVRYSNEDGKHAELRRLLATADRFIVPRHRRTESAATPTRPKDEVESAAALFLYRKLQGVAVEDSMSGLILAGLGSVDGRGVTSEDAIKLPSLNTFSNRGLAFTEAVTDKLKSLAGRGLVKEVSGRYSLSERGREHVEECKAARETERDQAYGQFGLDLKAAHREATADDVRRCKDLAEKCIVSSFASRGLIIANQVFAGTPAKPDELSDIFGYISNVAFEIDGMNLRTAFVETMHRFLVEPSSPQREYLASLSQGYFLYHHLGLDPKCSQLRRGVFARTLWLFDSSVLLPLAAVGCHNHDYAAELFQMLGEADAQVYSTPKLLQEAWEHFQWAFKFVKTHGVESPEFLRAALVRGSYKQNLFLDGFIRLASQGEVVTFGDYLDRVSPGGADRVSFEEQIASAGVRVLALSDMDGFDQDDWGEIEEAKAVIQRKRVELGTFRAPLQVESEAEIWVLIKNLRSRKISLPDAAAAMERAYFVSQSRLLDKLSQSGSVSTWSPESLYRYVSSLPGNLTRPDLLQQCMLHEYFYAGISFIDKARYLRFFGPSVDAAKASYEQEKRNYIREVEHVHADVFDEAFERTPDLEKPFFVAQMGWRVAEKAREAEEFAKRRATEAEAQVTQLKAEKSAAWRLKEKRRRQSDEGRLRNLQDPKHLRKRKRQAKNRARKKKR